MSDVDGCNIVKYFDALRPKESFFLPNYNNILDVFSSIQTQKIPNLFTATIPKNNHAFRLEVVSLERVKTLAPNFVGYKDYRLLSQIVT